MMALKSAGTRPHLLGPSQCCSAICNILFLLLVTFGSICSGQDDGVTQASDEADQAQPARLVWTELRIVDRRARIQSLPADPEDYITSSVISSKYYYELTPAHWIAIASDYEDGVAFWSDANHKRIMRGGLREGATASGIFEGTSSTVDGIAVDWLANNVYWTDAAYNWIVAVDYNMTWFRVIVDDGLEKPRGVAVHPELGYLFWTDWGSRQTIERSTLSGEDRQVLADTGLYFPNGITIDYVDNKLYWTDADPSGSRLETSNLNGTDRRTVYSHQPDQGHFFDVAVFQNYIFISDWYNGIRCIRKDTGTHYFALNIGGRPFGLTLHGPGLLPGNSSLCDDKPCSQLCVSDPDGFKCLCVDGFELQEDGRTCHRDETSLAKPQILLAAQNSICNFPSNFPDLTLPPNYQPNCILTNRTHIVALDVDMRRKTMFFSDFVHKTIQSVRLADGASVELVVGGVGSVEGIAVDWLSQNLYWTDSQLDHISVSRYDGSNRHILLKDNVLDPRSIVIHAGRRLMFWTEFGPPGQIERASLDGSNRVVILDNVDGLNGLSIDFDEDRIYYADRATGSIQHMDFDGNGRTRLYARTGAQFFDIDIHKDYLLWTEWNVFNGLHAINRENRRIVQSHSVNNESTYAVRVYSDDRQPYYDGVCEDNGGCQQLCLPISTGGMRCDCSAGYRLHSDSLTCVPAFDILYDEFLFASDAYLHSIFQFDLSTPNLNYSALQLDTRTIANPVALAYDPITAQVYWSDVVQNSIRRAYISNGSQEILFTHEHVETPDGLTIDPTSRLLFWTDMGLPSIQVAHLDGSSRKILVRSDIEHPRAILADPGNGLLYWSDWGKVAKIEQAFMDGTNRTVLANTSLAWPNGLALDFRANKLYWCDAKTDKIEALDLSSMVRVVLIDLGPANHPFSIALHGSYIYWSDWAKRTLMRADKNTGANNDTVGSADFARLNGLHVYSSQDHDPFSNACVSGLINGGCVSLCLPIPNGRTCACPDGSTLDQHGVTCSGSIQCQATFPHGRVQADCQRVPGSTCNVECDTGYQARKSRISCGPGGFWDVATDAVCEQVRCPSFTVPEHVNTVACPAPYFYGTQCRFSCRTGYTQIGGDEELTCTENGQWSGTLLTCQVVSCPALPALPSAVFRPKDCTDVPSAYNTTCHVLCRHGYLLNGVASYTCQANGQWTDADRESSCIDISPPDFEESCPTFFNLTASSGQITVNATWPEPQPVDNSGETPIIATNVRQPLLLGEGRHTVTYYASDSAGNTAICSFVIEVIVLSCDMLGYPINGYFEHCTQHYGSVCAIRCNEGFAVHGTAHRVCLREPDGSIVWTGSPASCRLIECRKPATSLEVVPGCSPPFYFRDECSYACAPGYERIRGNERRVCTDLGQWSGTELQCQRVTCPPLVPGEDATVNCQSQENFFGDTCTLACNDGYQLVGVANHTCLATGEWSDNDDGHFCQDVAAPHFNGTCPEDFSLLAPRGKDEAVVTWIQPVVMDNAGNQLNITSSRQPGVALPEGLHAILIQATDRAGNRGTCRFVVNITVMRCPLHPFPSFANFLGQRCDNYYGAQCNFSCLPGYQLSGSSSRTCEWNGQSGQAPAWSGQQPVCQAVTCSMFDYPQDTMYVIGCDAKARFLPYGSLCQTVCTEGKRPVAGGSDGQRRCREDGTWSGQNIQCEDVHCPVLTPPRYGIILPDNCTNAPSQFRTLCRYSCMPGFVLTGVSATLCLASGNWSSPEQHTCQDVRAPVFQEPCPLVMDLVPDSCTNGHVVSYEVPSAEDNSGVVNVTGGEGDIMGTVWPFGIYERSFTARDPSGNTAECLLTINVLRIQCPDLPQPAHGAVVSQTCGDQSGSVAEFNCDDGFLMIGSKYLACGQDGQWNATIPSCSAVYCSPLTAPMNGTLSPPQCTGNAVVYGTTCEITCASGYGLIGEESAACLSNNQWSNDISDSSCLDVTPPEMTCPPAQFHVLPEGKTTVQVTVEIPTATDNSGVPPIINGDRVDGEIGPGIMYFNFEARDATGNTKQCTTEVTIRDLEAPRVLSCPNDTVVEAATLPVTLQWEEPEFDDNIGIADVVSSIPNGYQAIGWGNKAVLYEASDVSRNTVTCRFVFSVEQNLNCPPLQPPPNGALACENGDYCTVHCNQGYVFLDKYRPRDVYICLPAGHWNHETAQTGIPYLPGCTERERRTRVRWERRDSYIFQLQHLQGSCQNQTQQIKENFIALFTNSVWRYCQLDPENNCKLENIEVTCGEASDGGRHLRRQALDDSGVNVDISPSIVIERNDTNISSVLSFLNTNASDMWEQDIVTLDLPGGATGVLDKDQSETGAVNVICGDGMVASGMTCVNCPRGTRYKLSVGDCVPCGKATYQDEEGMLTCKLCPQYTTTIGIGAFESTHCQEMCPPGQISYWGVKPCSKCPIGSYQSSRGQQGCEPCPNGMTTRVTGATTFSQCIASVVQPTMRPPDITTHAIQPSVPTVPPVTPGKATVAPATLPSKTSLPATTGQGDVIRVSTKPPGKGGKPGSTTQSPNLWIIIAVVCGLLVLAFVVIAACVVIRRQHSHLRGKPLCRPRPVSWAGSTRGMLTSQDDDEHDDSVDLVAIRNPVYGLNDDEPCTSPLSGNNFSTFLEPSEPPIFEDSADIPKLAPPPKKKKKGSSGPLDENF